MPYSSSANIIKPVFRILNGTFRGATLESANEIPTPDDAIFTFSKLTLKDGSVLDTDTPFAVSVKNGFAGSGAKVDNRLFEKLSLLIPLNLISSASEWITKKSTATSESATGRTTTEVVDPPTIEEQAILLAGSAAETTSELVSDNLDKLVKEWSLARGEIIDLVIIKDVFVKNELLY